MFTGGTELLISMLVSEGDEVQIRCAEVKKRFRLNLEVCQG